MRRIAKKLPKFSAITRGRKRWLIVGPVLTALILAGVFWYLNNKRASVPENYDEFAQCLTEKGVVMYGADWCSHCENQRVSFGDSFRFVNYVECMRERKLCKEKDIRGFPTWEFPGGMRQVGELSFRELSRESGCSLR